MENPMLQMLNQSRQLNNQPNNLMTLLENSNNPEALIKNLISQNPQITNLINQYGNGDPKTAFYAYAQKTGKDPEQILNMLKKFSK